MRRTYNDESSIEIKPYFYIDNLNLRTKNIKILKQASSAPTVTVEYSLDGQRTWQSQTTGGFSVNAPSMSRVYFRANASAWGSSASYNYFSLEANDSGCYYEFGGNIMSLLYGENFNINDNYLTLPNTSWHFKYLFTGITASFRCYSLRLTAQKALKESYYRMFYNATGLTYAPIKIYASTNNGSNSMDRMFEGCSNMVEGPIFRMSFTGSNTMQGMFQNCVKLTTLTYMGTNTTSQSTSSANNILNNTAVSNGDNALVMLVLHSSVGGYFSSFWNSLKNTTMRFSIIPTSQEFFPLTP